MELRFSLAGLIQLVKLNLNLVSIRTYGRVCGVSLQVGKVKVGTTNKAVKQKERCINLGENSPNLSCETGFSS